MKLNSFFQFVIILIILYLIGGCADRMPFFFNGKAFRYPDSKIVNQMRLKDGCYAELETKDSCKNVLKFYKYHMSKTGWSIRVEREVSEVDSDDPKSSAFLVFLKDNEGVMIDAYPSVRGDKTQIAMFMGDIDEQ